MKVGLACAFVVSVWSAWPTAAQSNRFGISRIVPGWTNYSTGFSMTHDADLAGEFATVASFYTPPVNVRPRNFGAIIIWLGQNGVTADFSKFSYRVQLWSGLDAFIQDPRHGDLATFDFSQPTGGSTTVRDSTTRGGRPAYHVRFVLPGQSMVLTQCHTYVIGLNAIAASTQAGELFVPTAPFEGDSDVQAGNIVPFGWTYLLNSGGATVYFGQLATELEVDGLSEPPRLGLGLGGAGAVLTRPDAASCYTLEMADELEPTAWLPITNWQSLPLGDTRFYRLVRESPSRLVR